MNEYFFGMPVIRQIPNEAMPYILSDQMRVYGGVVRWAPGTPKAGEIAYHLLPIQNGSVLPPFPPPDTIKIGPKSYKQFGPNLTSSELIKFSKSTMYLSGLNLAVTAVAFAAINQRFNIMEKKLAEIANAIKDVQEFLEQKSLSELKAAIKTVRLSERMENLTTRNLLLSQALHNLTESAEFYADQLHNSTKPQIALIYEECYCLASLARIRCLAEIEEFKTAQSEMAHFHQYWQTEARKISLDMLGESPERFLITQDVDLVPSSALTGWLDFAHNSDKGFDWIDELRRKPYQQFDQSTSSWNPISWWKGSSKGEHNPERDITIPALHKLTKRNEVLDGYISQMDMLNAHKVTPSEFEKQIASIDKEQTVDGFILLQAF
jgi:hypothetical protein